MNQDPQEIQLVSLSVSDRILGVLLGSAVGDALGLPAEGLSPRRIARLWKGDWRMRLVFGRGMVSDDTEHTIMVAQSLLASPKSAEDFQRNFARKLRWWFLGLSRGVTGYAFHTVPIAIYTFLRHGNHFHEALVASLSCGGDTDTVAAIVGALVGANVGGEGIPSEWLDAISDWPNSVSFLRRLAGELARPRGAGCPASHFWPGAIPRNLFFLAVVIVHGFRRLLPPYA